MEQKLKDELKSFEKVWKGGYKQCYSVDRGQVKIEKFVKELHFKRCLEIGCGNGHWSRMLNKNGSLVVIDAKSKEVNNFKVECEYHHIKDFELNEIADDSLDLVFSYDVFCHISKKGQELYLKNLYNKISPGGVCYIMIADPRKWAEGSRRPEHLWNSYKCFEDAEKDADGKVQSGRWFWIGLEPFKKLLLQYNYIIFEDDINLDPSAPIVKFGKKKN